MASGPDYSSGDGTDVRPGSLRDGRSATSADFDTPTSQLFRLETGFGSHGSPFPFPGSDAHRGHDDFVTAIANCAHAGARDALDALLEQLRASGRDTRLLYRDLIEPAARLLGDWWSEDRISSFEVTVALVHLQRSVRSLGAKIAATAEPEGEQVRDVAIVSHPVEPCVLGATLVGDVFRNAGWMVRVEFAQNDSEVIETVRAARYHILVLLLGDVHAYHDKLDAVGACIAAARKLSRNRSIAVIVGGRTVLERPDAVAATVGAEAAFTTAADALEKACDLLKIQRQRVAWRLLRSRPAGEEAAETWSGWRPV